MQQLALPNYSAASRLETWMRYSDFERALERSGWIFCGSGAECTVMLSPCRSRVCKILRGRDVGQFVTFTVARSLPDNPHLPTVYGDLIDNGDNWVAFECEALERAYESDTAPFRSSSRIYSGQRRVHPEDLEEYGALPDGPAKEALLALTREALNSGGGLRWDCHSQNLMVRPSDGSVVINDPLYN